MLRAEAPPLADHTEADEMPPRQANTEPIPGYRLLEPLGRGGFGEVWKCEAPGGLAKAMKFVRGQAHALDHDAPAEEELRAIERVKAIRHPFILSMERVERIGFELVIVLELADHSLADLFQTERQSGKPGIPRDPLLGYLREAAEALDVMNARYGLQHLDIKPQNLFLVSNHIKVGDFGLVNSLPGGAACAEGGLADPSPRLGAITPLYASPEVFQGTLSRHSDQYSLAVVYKELLTGTVPFSGKNARQLLIQHTQVEPDLSALPEGDRPVVARALAKDPQQRFPSCSDFIHALIAGQTEVVSATVPAEPPAGAAPAHADTKRNRPARTVTTRRLAARPPVLGPNGTGWTIGDLINRTPHTEAWHATAPDGTPRMLKVLFGFRAPAQEAGARLMALRHRILPVVEVLQSVPGRLVLAVPPAEGSLRDCLLASQAQGFPGIPRAALLADLRTATEALQALHRQYGLLHLALNPRNLLLYGDRLLLADFGLAELLWSSARSTVAQLNARYAAPELSSPGPLSPAADQYSLALIYHELLTGRLPAPSSRDRVAGSALGFPALEGLPEGDRALVARALDPQPQKRWDSALDFLGALEAAAEPGSQAPHRAGRVATLSEFLRRRTGADPGAGVLQTRFGTSLAADIIRERLEGFRAQWKGRVTSAEENQLVFRMQTPTSFWQRWIGRQPALEISVSLAAPQQPTLIIGQPCTEVHVDIRPGDCGCDQSAELLKVIGPLLVESVRTHLQVNPRGRLEERLTWQHSLQVVPLLPDGTHGTPIECQGKDISLNGIGFYLPGELPGTELLLHLPQTPQTPALSVPASVVRSQPCGDGWLEVGAILLHAQKDAAAHIPRGCPASNPPATKEGIPARRASEGHTSPPLVRPARP
jgi:serine/threonine protein kinase